MHVLDNPHNAKIRAAVNFDEVCVAVEFILRDIANRPYLPREVVQQLKDQANAEVLAAQARFA